jgi:hypothetical protein
MAANLAVIPVERYELREWSDEIRTSGGGRQDRSGIAQAKERDLTAWREQYQQLSLAQVCRLVCEG